MNSTEVLQYMRPLEECSKPGSFILDHVDSTGTPLKKLIADMLYKPTVIPVDREKYAKPPRFIPGAMIDGPAGPQGPVDVMVIGKIAEEADYPIAQLADYTDAILGSMKNFLIQAFEEAELDPNICYFTNMIRFPRIDHNWRKQIPVSWVKQCRVLLDQEIWLLQPKVIICMGTDASKAITGFPVTAAMSTVHEYTCGTVTSKVVCVNDPRAILANPEDRPLFLSGLSLVKDSLEEKDIAKLDRSKYHYVDTAHQLSELVDRLIAEDQNEFTIDCEWAGRHCLDYGSALRTIQVGWSADECMVVILHRQGMRKAFRPSLSEAAYHLRRLLQRPSAKFIGHNIGADYPWLREFGIDLSGQVYFDTMLASHLFEPTMSHKLEDLATKHVKGWLRQDFELYQWLKKNPQPQSAGFGNVPDDMLHPYSGDDVIATMRLYYYYRDKFEEPEFAGLKALFYDLVMPATLEIMKIEENGVLMDQERLMDMTEDYKKAYDTLLEDFRDEIDWQGFNPNSSTHKAKLLFGSSEEGGLGLTPLKSTDKPAMMWDEVIQNGMEDKVSPSTDGETLETLAKKHDLVKRLHQITLLSTTLKNQLCPKKLNTDTGNYEYTSGFMSFVKPDGRIHTRISQMLKTGRLASLDPNIMNIANKQEKAVQEVFRNNRKFGFNVPKLRSTFTTPPGSLMIISDYKQAEIAALAYLSQDATLIESVQNSLDIHSVVCKQMFNLDCTLEEVKIHHKALRVAAKSIVFGLLYGRGPKAIAREVEKAGVECTVDRAKQFVEQFMSQFPLVSKLISDTHAQVEQQGYVDTVWGRRAFYPKIESEEYEGILASQKRKAFNLLIQGYVADLLRAALVAFGEYKRQHPDVRYKIILTVHDSIVAEAPMAHVERVAMEVFPECMIKRSKCPALPFEVGVDTDVCKRWDVPLTLDDLGSHPFSKEFIDQFVTTDDDN